MERDVELRTSRHRSLRRGPHGQGASQLHEAENSAAHLLAPRLSRSSGYYGDLLGDGEEEHIALAPDRAGPNLLRWSRPAEALDGVVHAHSLFRIAADTDAVVIG